MTTFVSACETTGSDSADPVQPAVRVAALAELDAEQLVTQPQRDRSRFAIAYRPAAHRALHGADRGHRGSRAAGERLGELARRTALAPVIHRNPALVRGYAVVGTELEQRVPGDSGQRRAAERGRDDPGLRARSVDEEHVHAPHLLDPAAFG